jgi:myo-inositol catabolism protein IolC
MGAGVPGYVGLAIGRSIWWDPLKAYVGGQLPRERAADQIAENYLRFVSVYRAG